MVQRWKRFTASKGLRAGLGLGLILGAGLAQAAGPPPGLHGPLDAASAEVYWRWIGIQEPIQESCEPLDGLPEHWVASHLFSSAARARFAPLAGFCVYEAHGAGNVTPKARTWIDLLDGDVEHTDPAFPLATRPLKTLRTVAPDLMAVTESGALETALWPHLAALFDEQAGRVQLPPLGAANVRLTLLDTSPTGTGGGPETSDHGRTLRQMAKRLLCSTGPCLAEIRSRLALSFKSLDPLSRSASLEDHPAGGHLGLISKLAAAIVEEIDDWKLTAPNQQRLVLNLSVAWDRLYGGGDLTQPASTFGAPIQAVYRALESAACEPRVIAVAAAGNLSDLHSSNNLQEPLLPAAWRSRNAQCSLGPPGPPMVVAVGGIDRRREPLGNAIVGGLPAWAAYGDHAVVEDRSRGQGHTAVLTGSSVAALVASSTLSAVASYRPDLDLETLAGKTYDSGESLGVPADFCPASFAGNCPVIRGISLCEAVEEVCSTGGGLCPQMLPVCPVRESTLPKVPEQGMPGGWLQIDASLLSPVLSATCTTADTFAVNGCEPQDPCPAQQYHGLGRRPFVHPQPKSLMCPNCGVFLQGISLANQGSSAVRGGGFSRRADTLVPPMVSLYAEIDSGGTLEPGQALTAPTLELNCGVGPPQVYHLEGTGVPSFLQDGDQFLVYNLDSHCREGWLSFVLEESGVPLASVRQPLFLAVFY